MVEVTVSGTRLVASHVLSHVIMPYIPHYQMSSLSILNGTYILQTRCGRYS